MKITSYNFGQIEVDGHAYSTDIIITPDGVHHDWRRTTGYNLAIEDLNTVIDAKPQTVVVGSGYHGRMQVPQSTQDFLREKGIELKVAPTSEAVEIFNRLQRDSARVVAALHLTC